MPQEIRGSDPQRLARFSNRNPHHTRRNRAGSLLFARNGHRTSLEGVLNECVSVGLGPMQGKKKRARPHLPRITRHLANFPATRTRRQSCLHALEHFAQLSSTVRCACAGRVLSLAVNLVRGGFLYLFYLAQSNFHPNALPCGAAVRSSAPVFRTGRCCRRPAPLARLLPAIGSVPHSSQLQACNDPDDGKSPLRRASS